VKNNITIRMGAGNHDVLVKGADGKPVRFDLRTMKKAERSIFHRELMNAFRASQR
jgi:hypothetical protein